jgi:hypothetical protein
LDADQIRKIIDGVDIGQPIISVKKSATPPSNDISMPLGGKVAPA